MIKGQRTSPAFLELGLLDLVACPQQAWPRCSQPPCSFCPLGVLFRVWKAVRPKKNNMNLRVDMFGDALGAAVLPGDRWRKAHGAFQNQVYLDSRFLGCLMQKEVYGLFLRFFSVEGRNAFGKLSRVDK